MSTLNQNSDMQGGFTPTTSLVPNRIMATNQEGYASTSDVSSSYLATLASIRGPEVIIAEVDPGVVMNNAYMNANFPFGPAPAGFPVGSLVVFANLTGLPNNVAHVIRFSATQWEGNLTPLKLP